MNTNPAGTIGQHPSAITAYIRHGWRLIPIPYGSKAPTHANWNQHGYWIKDIDALPQYVNIGLAHAFSGTMALDVDNWDKAKEELAEANIDLQALYDAPDAVTIESSVPGHGKLLYAMPFGMVMPSKKLVALDDNGKRFNYLDFRCGTSAGTTVQDVLPPSMHPKTKEPYRWGGKGHWTRLPQLPFELLEFWQDHLTEPTPQLAHDNVAVSWFDVEDALSYLSPECDRETWIQIGMGLKHAGTKVNKEREAFQVWDQWSRGPEGDPCSKYRGLREISATWHSFRQDRKNLITIGTIFELARRNGWTRSTASVEHLFQATKPADLFAGLRPPAPDINLNLFPPILRDYVDAVSSTIGCDPLVPLFAGLGAVCGAVDARTRLELYEGYEVPPILWLCTIGRPADRKTPGSKPMFDVLRAIEHEDRPRHQRIKMEYDVALRLYTQHYEALVQQQMEAFNTSNTVQPVAHNPGEPPAERLIVVQDITSQKLMDLNRQRPEGLLCYLDEMNGWIRNLTQKGTSENRSTWVAGYEGNGARMDRIGRPTIECDPFSVAIYGNCQPRVWKEYLVDLSGDGFISRFIPAVLRHHKRRLSEPRPITTERKAYEDMVRMCFALPPQKYTLEPEAYELFREFQRWFFERQQEDQIVQTSEMYDFAFGKIEGTMARCALLFHLMESPHSPRLHLGTVQRAIDFTQSYLIPALRYAYGEVGGQLVNALEVWLASHILGICDKDETVTLRDLKRSAKSQITHLSENQKDTAIIDGMMSLEACKWVMLLDEDRRRHVVKWAINPYLKDTFIEYREKVKNIKKKRLDEMTVQMRMSREERTATF